MCGIAGKLLLRSGTPVHADEVKRMTQRLQHRGPDDEGIYVNPLGTVGLGHRRLSIIDLSPAGHNPMCNEDGTIWIVFNGEIYNFQSLRPDLERKGHTFRSHTDTEVIIHLYEEYGESCLQYLRGMFAFAIWDEKQQKLFLARDRVGKKPLKYYMDDQVFLFASELKAILTDPRVPREVDEEAIWDYLTYSYVPEPSTGFRKIRKLPHGHYAVIQHGKITITKYWDLDYTRPVKVSEQEYINMLYSKLEEAVRIRMISDVPIGAFLSGGLDSSTIVAMMAQNSSRPIKTYTIGFGIEKYNELPFAREVAKMYRTEHTELMVDPNRVDLIDKLIWQYEEPYSDSSALPSLVVSALARRHVTVILNGDGGDENFGGYPWAAAHQMNTLIHHIPFFLQRIPSTMLKKILHRDPRLTAQRIYALLSSGQNSLAYQYALYTAIFYPHQKLEITTQEFQHRIRNHESHLFAQRYYEQALAETDMDRLLYTDIHTNLSNDLLVKMDIASMAYALETRSPLLDQEFMELAARVPWSKKIRHMGRHRKDIFKRMIVQKRLLPQSIINKRKQGFQIPIEDWFRNQLKDYAQEVLLSSRMLSRGYFRKDQVERLLDNHFSSRAANGRRIWNLLCLELWFREYID